MPLKYSISDSSFFAMLRSSVPRWDQLCHYFRFYSVFLGSKVEEIWQSCAVRKASLWLTELIKVGIEEATERAWSGFGIVLQEARYEVNSLSWGSVSEDLLPR